MIDDRDLRKQELLDESVEQLVEWILDLEDSQERDQALIEELELAIERHRHTARSMRTTLLTMGYDQEDMDQFRA